MKCGKVHNNTSSSCSSRYYFDTTGNTQAHHTRQNSATCLGQPEVHDETVTWKLSKIVQLSHFDRSFVARESCFVDSTVASMQQAGLACEAERCMLFGAMSNAC